MLFVISKHDNNTSSCSSLCRAFLLSPPSHEAHHGLVSGGGVLGDSNVNHQPLTPCLPHGAPDRVSGGEANGAIRELLEVADANPRVVTAAVLLEEGGVADNELLELR